jgi:hypothetical protein
LGARVADEVRGRIADDLLVPLEEFEASRAALGKAALAAEDCE